MPGELERVLQALLGPKPSKTNLEMRAPALAIVSDDATAATFTDSGATATLNPSNLWDTAKWGECGWSS